MSERIVSSGTVSVRATPETSWKPGALTWGGSGRNKATPAGRDKTGVSRQVRA